MTALRDLSNSLNNQEPPAAQPKAIRVQQNLLQEIKQEIDQVQIRHYLSYSCCCSFNSSVQWVDERPL